jgi:hypothetical protein
MAHPVLAVLGRGGKGRIVSGNLMGFGDKLIERGRTYLMKVHTFCADQLEIGVKG